MIDFYYFPTPNTWKVAIMLEECNLDHRVIPIDITKGEQFSDKYLEVNPNGKVPAIVDHGDVHSQAVFESGAILIYLAEKTGKLLHASGPARVAELEWLFWQVSGLGPMAGQANFFRRYAPEVDYAVKRYVKEANRLYGVMDRRLASGEFLAGDYSIADISCWSWVWFHQAHGQKLDEFQNINRWFNSISERSSVERGRQIGMEMLAPEIRAMFEGPYFQVSPTLGVESTRSVDAVWREENEIAQQKCSYTAE